MTADLPRLSAIGRDVARFATALARTARSRHLYAANNEALVLMRKELRRAADDVFRQVPEISLGVGPDALRFGEEEVLSDDGAAEDSLPFLLYRDGVRKLVFLQGITDAELEALVRAINQGRSGRTLEDDIVVHLWRHGFEHLRYVTVEVHVADAEADVYGSADVGVEQQVDAVLRSLYSDSVDGDPARAVSIDANEEAAKALADTMSNFDEMAVGFHPSVTLASLPAYAGRLFHTSSDEHIYTQFIDETAEVLSTHPSEGGPILSSYLALFDAAVVDGDLELATQIVSTVRGLQLSSEVQDWLTEALSDVRLRQVTQLVQAQPQLQAEVEAFFQAAGSRAVPALVRALPGLTQPRVRRRFSDLALELGTPDDLSVRELVFREQGFAACEGLYLLARMDKLRDRTFLREVEQHPSPQVRLALIQEIDRVPHDVAAGVLAEMLDDPSPRVQVAAIETLAQQGGEIATRALVSAIERHENAPESVKRALFVALASVLGVEAIQYLEPIVVRADAWMARTAVEEAARAAVYALGQIRHEASVEVLRTACDSKSRSARTSARKMLERMKGDSA